MAMARSRTLVVVLLLVLTAGAHHPGDAAEAAGCPQPDAVATGVALFCSGWLPTEPCCQTLAQAGAGCLCLIASEPPLAAAALNRTDLTRLYAGCVAHGHVAAASSSSACDAAPDGSSGPCASLTVADQLSIFCSGNAEAAPPTAPCCEALAAAVGVGARDAPCFCRAVRASGVGFRRVVGLYAACGGLRTELASQLVNSCARIPRA